MKTETVKLPAGINGFAEDKDEAKRLRISRILPAFGGGQPHDIILDFSDINYSTQSFIHALLGEVLQRYGESALEHIQFKKCAPQVKSLIRLVVDYSLGGFQSESPLKEKKTVKRTTVAVRSPKAKKQ
jgi:STAS-like domain of unknown function (DUF4325)